MRKSGKSRSKGTIPHKQTGTGGHTKGLFRSAESMEHDRRVQRRASSMSYADMKTGNPKPRMERMAQSICMDIWNGRTGHRRATCMVDMEYSHDIQHYKHARTWNIGVRISACICHGQTLIPQPCDSCTTDTAVCSCGHMATPSDIGACIDSPRYRCRCSIPTAWCDGSGESLGQPRLYISLGSGLALANKGDS